MNQTIVVILTLHKAGENFDVELPLNMTANELIVGLNEGFHLGLDTTDISRCSLKTENPVALLRGNRTLAEYGLRDGTTINFTA